VSDSTATRGPTRTAGSILKAVLAAALSVLVIAVVVLLLWRMPSPGANASADYEVVGIYPHDFRAFTQGLVYDDGRFYESTGRLGASSVRRVHVGTGVVLQKKDLEDEHFGEGLALVGDHLIQLTWTSQIGFVHDRATLEPVGEFSYPGEGWGLAYDGAELVMSDGTAELRFLDPATFAETRRVTVVDTNGPVTLLNELEYVEGEVWANIWQTDRIARISPETGDVIGYINLEGLLDHWAWSRFWPLHTDVLNGIAYDDETDRVFVTGKLWPVLFEIGRT